MTLLTKKVADEVGKSIDNVNQVDEVHAHSDPDVNAGNLDNANQIEPQPATSNIVVPSNLSGLDAVEYKRLSDVVTAKGLNPSSIVALHDDLGLKRFKKLPHKPMTKLQQHLDL